MKDNLSNEMIELLEKENKKLSPIDFANLIFGDNYKVEELNSIIKEINRMCQDGVLRETNSGGSYVINECLVGTVDLHERGNAHIIIPGVEDIFIARNDLKGARDKDTVMVDYKDKNKNEGKVIKILKRSIGKQIGEVINENGKLSIHVIGEEELPFRIEIEETDINLVDGLLVKLEYVRDISRDRVLARISDVIGHKNALLNEGQEPSMISGEVVKIAAEFGLRLTFPDEVLEEAKNMPKELSEEMLSEGLKEGRTDFRNEVVITIDGKDTKDIDDAISIKILPNGNYELGVHIADVSYYVNPGTALWAEAEKRGNSNYLGNKVLPMLPVELSNGICSLNPNEDRFTTSCVMEVNHSGKAISRKVVKGIIRSRKKMNYDAVQDIIDDKETEDTKDYTVLKYIAVNNDTIESIAFQNNITVDDLLKVNEGLDTNKLVGKEVNIPCRPILKNMHTLSKMISANKERRGELKFVSDETKIYQDENDEVIDIKARDQRPSERIIEDFMVIANEQVAEYLNEFGVATFRIHDKPLQKKIEDYLKFLELQGMHYPGKIDTENVTSRDCQRLLEFIADSKMYKALNKKLLRSMKKAVYSIENVGHFGIASPMYTHFTSPIRRFDDLLNHYAISELLKNDEALDSNFIKKWVAYLGVICDYISECERNSEKCEYEVDDMLKASYMINHIGEEFEATVDSLMPGAFFVQTDNYVDGRVDVIKIGEKNMVSVSGYFDFNEDLMAYTRNGRAILRYGDKVKVVCIDANIERREVDFMLILGDKNGNNQ